MHLKEIRISGFKSYKLETVVDNLDAKHNVIVGRNGSGKSNFFSAIEFVLSDTYSSLRPAHRVSLINKGSSKNRSDTAFVEIVFDPSPTSEKSSSPHNCICIRRTISATKDQYTINGRNATRKELVELLDSLDLPSSNPHNIVKQGTINRLATSRPQQLLELLYETGGIRSYDEKLKQIEKLWQDAENGMHQIRTERTALVKRVELLTSQQREQQNFELLEKKHRVLQYVTLEKQQQHAREQLDALAQAGHEWEERQHSLLEEKLNAVRSTKELKKNLKQFQSELANAEEQRSSNAEEHLQLDQQKTRLELALEDMQKDLKRDLEECTSEKELLQQHNQEIEALQQKLKNFALELSNVQAEGDALDVDIAKKTQQRSELLNKLRRVEQFSSREERDRFLQQEIAYVRQQMESETKALDEARQALAELTEQLAAEKMKNETDTQQLKLLTEQERTHQKRLADSSSQLLDFRRVLDEWLSLEANQKQELSKYKARKTDLEQALRKRMGAATFQGWKSVRKVLEMLGDDDRYDHVREGYGGIVLELFECDEELYPAVETVAGNALLSHVVETDAVANTLIALCNRHGLPGEFQFMPLSRLRPAKCAYPQDDRSARPLISLLRFAPDNGTIFQHIFGKALLCDDMDAAVRATRRYGLTSVTGEGDIVRRGVMTGGYRAPKDSMIRLGQSLSEVNETIGQLVVRLGRATVEIEKTTKLIADSEQEQASGERALEQHKQGVKQLQTRIHSFPERCRQLEAKRTERVAKIRTLDSALELLAAKRDGLRRELATPLACELSEEDRRVIERLDAELRALGQARKDCFNAQLKVEQQTTKLENRLNVILIPKRDALLASPVGKRCKELRENILHCKREQDLLMNRLKQLQDQIGRSEQQIQKAKECMSTASTELEAWLDKLKTIEETITMGDPAQMRHANRMSTLQNELREYAEQISVLGVLPAVDRVYYTMTLPKLMKELDHTAKQMKTYGGVNRAATDESTRASQELSAIDRKLKTLEDSRKVLMESIQLLRAERANCVEQTFADVKRNFGEIFQKLVPTGCGLLTLQTVDEEADGVAGEHNLAEGGGTAMERYVGLRLEVAFHSSNGEVMRDMNALSGGQKTLVAIALLFAIQRQKPAPFYLFDEIDQALDAHHRKVIADEVAAQSASAQFVCITFRRELVERADKCFGVRYRHNMSFIDPVSKEQAYDFVTDASIRG